MRIILTILLLCSVGLGQENDLERIGSRPQLDCRLVGIEKKEDKGITKCTCILESSGFTPGDKYSFYVQQLDSPREYNGQCTAGDDGSLYCKRVYRKPRKLSSILRLLEKFEFGEPIEYILENKETGRVIRRRVIPNPLLTEDAHGRQVQLVMLSKENKTFLVELTGFEPGERIREVCTTRGEDKERVLRIPPSGSVTYAVHPGVSGRRQGTASLEINPLAANEPLVLDYKWGRR